MELFAQQSRAKPGGVGGVHAADGSGGGSGGGSMFVAPAVEPENAVKFNAAASTIRYLDPHSPAANEAQSTTFGVAAPTSEVMQQRCDVNASLQGGDRVVEELLYRTAEPLPLGPGNGWQADVNTPESARPAKKPKFDPLAERWKQGHSACHPPVDEFIFDDPCEDEEFAQDLANAEKAFFMRKEIEENKRRAQNILARRAQKVLAQKVLARQA